VILIAKPVANLLEDGPVSIMLASKFLVQHQLCHIARKLYAKLLDAVGEVMIDIVVWDIPVLLIQQER